MKKYNIVIVGATGAVGETLLQVLAEQFFPIHHLYLVASARSAGKLLSYQGAEYTVHNIAEFDFAVADIAFFAAGSAVAAKYAPIAAEKGCIVIDKSAYFRMQSDIPLIVPDVNPDMLKHYKNRNIIAVPNCSTIQMVIALKPIYDAVGIARINVVTYQAVSGSGVKGCLELEQQITAEINNEELLPTLYKKTIAFNVIPQCDEFLPNDYTKEEMKLVEETQKIFNDTRLQINATAVRVPVFVGHSEAIHIETRRKITKQEVLALLTKMPGVVVFSDNSDYPTALDVEGSNEVYVGRVREDISHPLGLNLWVVADNTRKGAAYTAVQIAECLIQRM